MLKLYNLWQFCFETVNRGAINNCLREFELTFNSKSVSELKMDVSEDDDLGSPAEKRARLEAGKCV